MTKIKCFEIEESASHPGKFLIKPIHNNFHLGYTTGSYNIICARLVSLSYADYLRMCRDCFGAEIMGINSIYPVAYFQRSKELSTLVDLLNARANMVLWEREHPDFEKHEEYVKKHNPNFVESN